MATIDYENVKPEDLEMQREPRKSTITVVHKPTGTVASDPVVPGSMSPARYRRPAKMPKENRVKGMDGFIEGRDEDSPQLYIILMKKDGAEEDKNEYLIALASDPAALKVSFEGPEKTAAGAEAAAAAPVQDEVAQDAPDEVAQDAPEEVEHDALDVVAEEEGAPEGEESVASELDDLLAEIDS